MIPQRNLLYFASNTTTTHLAHLSQVFQLVLSIAGVALGAITLGIDLFANAPGENVSPKLFDDFKVDTASIATETELDLIFIAGHMNDSGSYTVDGVAEVDGKDMWAYTIDISTEETLIGGSDTITVKYSVRHMRGVEGHPNEDKTLRGTGLPLVGNVLTLDATVASDTPQLQYKKVNINNDVCVRHPNGEHEDCLLKENTHLRVEINTEYFDEMSKAWFRLRATHRSPPTQAPTPAPTPVPTPR